ncbi:PREDICTED: PI-PLC X domain-containing protein 3 [Rhagoletis zephyria]|uniref:PI-PLC X domain-containing protein 3 n=1 Tax=Rhagoletis zephyria TaxID=28612 RepID=UPI0008112AF3|nr:PREDICTED: PI-PLC X domain-containing protein 3 [Rhagoletis zephyria]
MKNGQWMTSLPIVLRSLPVINLAIPGSHDSMSYGIKSGAKPAPDAEKSTIWLNFCFPWFVRRWAKTQSSSVLEQLGLGVRYFDLRVCQKNDKYFFAHGLFAMEAFEPLEEVKQFLISNKEEVCILDFQHFYDMDDAHHIKFQSQLLQLFDNLFFARSDGSLVDFTLNKCGVLGRQVLLIYRRCPVVLPNEFWPSNYWPTPWPNVTSVKKLEKYLRNALLSRNPSQGFVSQCILTPSGKYIALRFFSSLRKTAKKVDKKLQPWIEEQTPGPFREHEAPTTNVFMADFVNLKDGKFCNMVIELNYKLKNF